MPCTHVRAPCPVSFPITISYPPEEVRLKTEGPGSKSATPQKLPVKKISPVGDTSTSETISIDEPPTAFTHPKEPEESSLVINPSYMEAVTVKVPGPTSKSTVSPK